MSVALGLSAGAFGRGGIGPGSRWNPKGHLFEPWVKRQGTVLIHPVTAGISGRRVTFL